MSCIIIAAPRTDQAKRIAELIRTREVDHAVFVCSSGSSVLREANEQDDGVILCTPRLKDMSYLELFDYLPECFNMIIMTKHEALELPSERMKLILIPFTVGDLISLIETRLTRLQRSIRKRTKTPPKRTPKEQALIERAKHILMERQGMSEPEAYRHIQKESMDQGRTFLESAQMIILLAESWQ